MRSITDIVAIASAASPIGQELASMLMGLASSGSMQHQATSALQDPFVSAFIQDDIKLLPSLTVNIGLRYEVEWPMTERYDRMVTFRDKYRGVDVLLMDDIEFLAGKERTQEEFFHTFNALYEAQKQVVISSDCPAREIPGVEERLRSRFAWGLIADIQPPDYAHRLDILRARATALQLEMPEEALAALAALHCESVRELEGALNRIIADMQLIGREVTLETAQELLRDLLRSCERRVTIDEIQRRVAEHFNIRLSEMTSELRARAVARPRQIAMYLAKQLTTRSLPEIGRKFGGRDHTTVMHAVRKIEELTLSDRALAEDVELLRRMLQT